jgi:putative membrane protein
MKIQASLFAAALALLPAFAFAQSSSTPSTGSSGSATSTGNTGSSSTTSSGMPTNDSRSSATGGYQPDSAQPQSQATRTDHDHDAMPKKLTDTELLPKLHHVNQEEIKAGQLAQQQSSSSDVKDYGKMLVKDHQQADQELTTLAKTINVDLTAMKTDTKSPEKREVKQHKMDQLQTMTGKDFDRGFLQMMVNGHQHVIDIVKASRDDARPEVKALLDKQLPVLQKHLDTGKDLLNKMGDTASAR